jgi:hypothetical protein
MVGLVGEDAQGDINCVARLQRLAHERVDVVGREQWNCPAHVHDRPHDVCTPVL